MPTSSGVPVESKRPDGQYTDHWVLCDEERSKGYIRPLRLSYTHVGPPGPRYPLRDLTPDEHKRYDQFGYVKYEAYPNPDGKSDAAGMFWTQDRLDRVGKGCRGNTTMPRKCAETYARKPDFYGSTFCCDCGKYLPVGEHGEFVWQGTNERVGT